jgi:hypothetical protein
LSFHALIVHVSFYRFYIVVKLHNKLLQAMKRQQSLSNQFSTKPFIKGIEESSVQVSVQVHILNNKTIIH